MKNLTIRTKIFIVIIVITTILLLIGLFAYLAHKTSSCPAEAPLEIKEEDKIICMPCNADFGMHAENCTKACPNRYVKDEICLPECSKDTPLRTKGGICESCDDKRDLPVINCSICPNRYITDNGYCALKRCSDDKPLDDPANGCFSCDRLDIIHAKNCSKCPNRYLKSMPWDDNLFYCVLKACPSNAPLRLDDGQCFSCEEKKSFSSAENCKVCPNRTEKDGRCILTNCPANQPLRSNEGSCYSCDILQGIKSDNCSVCSNRESVDGFCRLKKCPEENSARGKNGSCYSCDNKHPFPLEDSKGCDICKNRSVIKDESGVACAFTTCPNGDFKDIFGSCIPCLTSGGILSTPEECEKCKDDSGNPVRIIGRGTCYLNIKKEEAPDFLKPLK